MKNFLEVLRFELRRNFKKPSYWLAAIALPVTLGLYIGIVAFAGYSAGSAFDNNAFNPETAKIAYSDTVNYISDEAFSSLSLNHMPVKLDTCEAGIEAVQKNEYDLFFCVSESVTTNNQTSASPLAVAIYVKPERATINGNYAALVEDILQNTAHQNINSIDLAVIQNSVSYQTTIFDFSDNHVIDISEMLSRIIAPGAAIVMFYILIVVLGNRLVAAMTEEKENRISELLLVSIRPIHLILGKTISLMILGLVQIIVLLLPIIIAAIVASQNGLLPFDLSLLHLDAISIVQNVLLLLGAYFIFTAFSILIGVISPSAKDANSYASIIVILTILPMMLMNIFIENSNVFLVQFFSYFPPTAPLALMFRGIFSTISPLETWIGIAVIVLVGFLVLILATHIFSNNALGFKTKRKLFRKSS